MTDAPAAPAPTPAAPEPSAAATTPPAAPTPPAAAAPAPAEPAADPWADPAAARAEIERLRKENGAARTNAKAQAAEEAKKELLKALGLGDEAETDPVKLSNDLATERSAAQQARVELAVFRNAATVGGDPAALLDSTSFLKSLEAIDPSDATAVSAAIATAIAANPRLGAAPAAPADPITPAPNPAQGAGAAGAPGLEAQIAEATKAGNHRLAIALKRQLHASQATT